MERQPAVSGFFYPASGKELLKLMEDISEQVPAQDACQDPIGVLVPHAGLIYSGVTAMFSYKALVNSQRHKFVILGPNHNSDPRIAATFPEGMWRTPLGSARVDQDLSMQLSAISKKIVQDSAAHSVEHSIEVQIPFLQYLYGNDFEFTPISLGDQSMETCLEIANVLLEAAGDAIIVASSDLTHYEIHESAERKDHDLISVIESLDVSNLYRTIGEKRISSCGYGAIAVLMEITRRKGGSMSLLDYRTSGKTSGDYSSVVGYASMLSCP